ncbi:MAG: hypothetical protein IAE98_02540 [Candidatus Kapabacteria bacterium]|nr:hypothetical protein [Candidatus Kapabacteria bacterium]
MKTDRINFSELVDKVKSVRRLESSVLLLTGLLSTLIVAFAVLFLITVVESIAHGSVMFRTTLVTVFVGLTAAAAFWYLFPSVLRALGIRNNPSEYDIALRIGEYYPQVKDNLCNAMQLVPLIDNPRGASPELALAAYSNVSNIVKDLDFTVVIDKNKLKRAGILFFAIASVFIASLTIFSTTLGESLFRISKFSTSFLPPVPFTLDIEPKDDTILRSQAVEIKVIVKGEMPDKIYLNLREDLQSNFDKIELKPNEIGEYVYAINSLKSSITFYGSTEWFSEEIVTETGKINVVDKPIVRSINGRLIYPSYTNTAPRYFDEKNGDLSALLGSKVEITVFSSKPVVEGNIVFVTANSSIVTNEATDVKLDTTKYALSISGQQLNSSFRINRSGYYFVEVFDEDGNTNEEPINYSVIALTDEYPRISMVEPEFDVQINTNALLPIKTLISDDYGISTLKLYYRLAQSPYAAPDEKFTSFDVSFVKDRLDLEVNYVWDLNKLGIMPDDIFEFYLEVADNDIVSGPKKSKTQTVSVRLPSLSEVQKDAELAQEYIEKNLEKLLKETLEIKRDLEDLNRELAKNKNKEPDWQQKKKTEDLSKRQNELRKEMNKLSDDLEQTTQKMENNNLISQETLDKFKELQNLMKQVDSPELRRMQQKMQDALKNMDQDAMKKALEQFKFDEEQFRKNIERTMKILKRIQAEQKTDALRKKAEDLAERQEQLSADTEKSDPKNQQAQDELSKRQEKLERELDQLEKDLNSLDDLLSELGEEQLKDNDLQQAKEDLNAQETKSEMDKSEKSLKSGDFKKSQPSQKKAAENLKKFAKKMDEMKENMKQQGMEQAIKQMQKSLEDMIELSKNQQSVRNNTSKSDFNSTQLPKQAQQQAELFESLANVAKAMAELSEKSFAVTPEMGMDVTNALSEMRSAVENMADRNIRGANQAQNNAMGSMNKAASQMQDMVQTMKDQQNGSCNNPGGEGEGEGEGKGQGKGSGGMGMSQKMQEIAAQQQAVNQAMQKMMEGGSGQGGREQMQKQAEMGRLADKQGQAQKSLEELAEEQKQFAPNKEKLGELNRIAKDMEEIMNDINSGNVTPETLKKQERILSRLLDESKSVHDRDYEKQRKADSGQNIFGDNPNDLDLSTQEGRKELMRQLLERSSKSFSKDYENLIRAYFNNLEKNNQ